MTVNIFTLKQSTLNKEAASLTLKTVVGEITILDNHRPYLTFAEKGQMRLVDNQGQASIIDTAGGVIEVLPGSKVNLLLESMEENLPS